MASYSRKPKNNSMSLLRWIKQLRYQQNLEGRKIAILVLPHANWIKLQPRAETIARTISSMKPGNYIELEPS